MFARDQTSVLLRAATTFPAVVLTGPRQVGKTTVLRAAFPAHRYSSLDEPETRERASSDPVGFLRENDAPVILDEVQHVPSLFAYVKARIDEDRRPGRWILSGSQTFSLMQGVSDSLAGRAAVLAMSPLAVSEVVGRPDPGVDARLEALFSDPAGEGGFTGPTLSEWIFRGAWPEPHWNPAVDRRLWFSSYIATYLERDVRNVLNVGDLRTFERFVRLVAARTTQLLNASDLARDAGVSAATATRWLSVLEASGLLFLLPPLHMNLAKRWVKAPKIYWVDAGLAAFLVGWHDPSVLMSGPMAGALVETAVVAEWVKLFRNAGESPPLSFFRTADGLEVDLIVERNGRIYPMEIKATSTVTPRHAGPLGRFRAMVGGVPGALVLADVPRALAVAPGVVARPWHLLG